MPRDSEKRWCTSTLLSRSSSARSSSVRPFSPAGAQWLLLPKEARQTVVNLLARILRERVLRNHRTEAPGGGRDY